MRIEDEIEAWMASLEEGPVGLSELMGLSGLPRNSLRVLVESGLVELQPEERGGWRCSLRAIERVRMAGRLRADFGLDDAGLLLALTLLERIEALEAEVRRLRCQLPRT
ncbi:MAG: hypothetical protein OHK0026_13910 [Rhodocyclaceae bacterium]